MLPDLDHCEFVFVSTRPSLYTRMIGVRGHANAMLSADTESNDWKKSDSFYGLSMDQLTRSTAQRKMHKKSQEFVAAVQRKAAKAAVASSSTPAACRLCARF